ncbi:PorT family protein [Mucilaginibacter conchicola]|uniref:PorT family protein n=1 Tax=Mucilaginibacter conchicola TaxID=2303333 RepID=A0A372NYC2_9SPHI|nr:porin family protein [Mucilaginibacter conchicola]RFZ95032.1 PorT family protein [Mucilaginibacter conchicola]
MRKFLLSVCCAFAVSSAFAQVPSFGIRGGIGFAKLSASNGNISVSTGSTTTFAAGVFADFKTGNNFSIQPALNYVGKGGNVSDDGAEVDIKTYYLQVPINVVYHVPAVFGHVYFGAGPYVAMGLSGKAKASDGTNSASEDIHFGSGADEFKKIDAGLNGIAGFEFKNGFLIGLNYDLGLTDIGNDGTSEVSTKNRVFGVSIGFKF